MLKQLSKEDYKNVLYKRPIDSHKGLFGYIALIGGSEKYSGAIKLASMANAAMRMGCGVCKVCAPKNLYEIITKNILEATFFPLSCDGYNLVFVEKEFKELIKNTKAIAIGMGIGDTKETQKAIKYLLSNYNGILIIDADGINAFTKIDEKYLKNTKAKVVFTPHLKEFQRLLIFKYRQYSNNIFDYFKKIIGKIYSINNYKDNNYTNKYKIDYIKENVEQLATDFAKYYNVNIIVKGSENIITDGIDTYKIVKGTPGMATAGSGDVLSGIIAAILGYNENNILMALAVACYVNGLAGEIACKKTNEISMIASDTVSCIKDAVGELVNA